MSNIDKLISKFKELKEELSKNVNQSYSGQQNSTTGTSGGEGGMYRSDEDLVEMAEKGEANPKPKPKKPDGTGGMPSPVPNPTPPRPQEIVKYEKNGQWSLEKAKILDFKSGKKVADLPTEGKPKPKEYTAHHKGIDKNGYHKYDIHGDGMHVGSVSMHHGGHDIKHKLNPDVHRAHHGAIVEAVYNTHEEGKHSAMIDHLTDKLQSPEKKSSAVKKSTEEFTGEIIEELDKKSTSKEIEEVRQEMIHEPVKGFGSGNKGPGMGNRGAWSMGAQGGYDGKQRSDKPTKLTFKKNGQWSLDKVDPDENVNIPHPKTKAKMADGVNKDKK